MVSKILGDSMEKIGDENKTGKNMRKFIVEAYFVPDTDFRGNLIVRFKSIGNMIPDIIVDYETLNHYKEMIAEHDFDEIDGIEVLSLDELKEYDGKFEIEIEEWGGYDNWTGEHEYDYSISCKCLEFKEQKYVSDLNHVTNFAISGNNDGDYLIMKYLPIQKKVRIDVGHCCISHRNIIADVTTLTSLIFDHFHRE